MRAISMVVAVGACLGFFAPAAEEKKASEPVTLAEPVFSVSNERPQLSFKVVVTDGALLGAELLRFGVTSWKDDKGTDLGTKDPKAFYGDVQPSATGSGGDYVVQLTGKNKPADGATTMSIEGTVPFKIGSDLREGVAKGVVLKEGTTFDVGPYPFRIVKIAPHKDLLGSDIVECQLVSMTFNAPVQLKDFSFIKEFTFLNADGTTHASEMRNFMGSFKDGGEHKLSIAVLPSQNPLDLRWAVYGRIAVVSVPLNHSGPVAGTK